MTASKATSLLAPPRIGRMDAVHLPVSLRCVATKQPTTYQDHSQHGSRLQCLTLPSSVNYDGEKGYDGVMV